MSTTPRSGNSRGLFPFLWTHTRTSEPPLGRSPSSTAALRMCDASDTRSASASGVSASTAASPPTSAANAVLTPVRDDRALGAAGEERGAMRGRSEGGEMEWTCVCK